MAKAHKIKYLRNSVAVTVPLTAQGTLAVTGAATLSSTLAVTGNVSKAASNGSLVNLKVAEGLHTVVGGGITETITNAIPAGSCVLAVTTRVTTVIVAATGVSWDLGVAGATTRYAENIVFTAGTTTTLANALAASSPVNYGSATSLVATLDAGTWTSGAIRWKVYYIDVTAPTG